MASKRKQQNYKISPASYLLRAKRNLESNNLSNLFYAAFELRCGIEAQLREYLYAHDHIPRNDKKSWNLDHLNKSCTKYLNTHDKIQEITFLKNDKVIWLGHYVPVSQSLVKNGQMLGNYLHDMKEYLPAEHSYWSQFRNLLIETYYELALSCSGTMASAGILSGNKIHTPLLGNNKKMKKAFVKGETASLKVRYLTIEEYLAYFQTAGKKLKFSI